MKCKQITLLIFSLMFFTFAQEDNSKEINQFDENGKKSGLWIEGKGNYFIYYKNGEEDGVHISYNRKNGRLSGFGECTQGNKSGIWYYFDTYGLLVFTETNINKNKTLSRIRDDKKKIFPKFSSYVKNYFPNGVVKSEGLVLYEEDIEIDYYETGIWKYYSKTGELVETKTN